MSRGWRIGDSRFFCRCCSPSTTKLNSCRPSKAITSSSVAPRFVFPPLSNQSPNSAVRALTPSFDPRRSGITGERLSGAQKRESEKASKTPFCSPRTPARLEHHWLLARISAGHWLANPAPLISDSAITRVSWLVSFVPRVRSNRKAGLRGSKEEDERRRQLPKFRDGH